MKAKILKIAKARARNLLELYGFYMIFDISKHIMNCILSMNH